MEFVENKFNQFLLNKFRQWEASKGSRQSLTSFARYLGVKQPTLTRWMQGDNVPDAANLAVLAKRLGPEIYDIFGYERPREISVDYLPERLRSRLDAARREIEDALTERMIDPETDEGLSVVLEILDRHGFTVRDIE